jgi:hypothetical protein
MDLLIKALTQWRRTMLTRQARAVRQAVEAMTPDQRRQAADHTLAEISAAAAEPLPHLYGEPQTSLYRPWSQVATTMARRTTDRSIQLRLRGVGTWLAVVYHETRHAPGEGMQALHREVLGILRELQAAKIAARTGPVRLDAAA